MRSTSCFYAGALPEGLASHQVSALAWLKQRPVGLLADATGSGKTAIAAAFIGHAFDSEGARKALWVTEAHLIPQALQKLTRFLPTLRVARWPGSSGDCVRVVSVETCTRKVDAVAAWQADVAVIDEASAVKGVGPEPAAVTRAVASATRRLAMTAAPLELDATECFRLLRVLDAPGLPTEQEFGRCIEWQELPYGETRPWGTRPESIGRVRGVFAPHVLRRGVQELGLVLPDLTQTTIRVPLTAPQREAYRQANGARSPMASSAKREKACAFAGGRSAKAEAAVDYLVQHPESAKAVIYAERLAHLDIVERLLDQEGIGWVRIDGARTSKQRREMLARFRDDPQVRVLLGSKVLERGIDGLQHCGVMITLGATWNPAREAQRIGRLRRPGSPHPRIQHITISTDTDHDDQKAETLRRRSLEAVQLVDGHTGTTPSVREIFMRPASGLPDVTARRTTDPERVLDETERALQDCFDEVDKQAQAAVLAGRVKDAETLIDTSGRYRRLARQLRTRAEELESLDQLLPGATA